jgi:hypothetical protein
MPGNEVVGMTNNELFVIGTVLTATGFVLAWFGRRMAVPA